MKEILHINIICAKKGKGYGALVNFELINDKTDNDTLCQALSTGVEELMNTLCNMPNNDYHLMMDELVRRAKLRDKIIKEGKSKVINVNNINKKGK